MYSIYPIHFFIEIMSASLIFKCRNHGQYQYPSSTLIRAPRGALTGQFKGPLREARKGPICKMQQDGSRGPRGLPGFPPRIPQIGPRIPQQNPTNILKGPLRGPRGLPPDVPQISPAIPRTSLGTINLSHKRIKSYVKVYSFKQIGDFTQFREQKYS